MISCIFCREPVNPLVAGSYSKQQGWVQVRKQGGAHALVEPKALNEVAHSRCIEDQKWLYNQQAKINPVTTPRDAFCAECKKVFDPGSVGCWSEVIGWVGFRTRGGTNTVTMRRPTGAYLHDHCWAARHSSNQELLF